MLLNNRTILLLCLVMISTAWVRAQPNENDTYKAITSKLVNAYNASQYEAVFNSFSPQMQAALPLDKTTAFLSGLKQQAGSITQNTFTSFHQTYATYKSTFEKTTLTLTISIDSNQRIGGLSFRPFKDERKPTPARNTTALMLPFKDEWTVVWGGDTKEQNYHVANKAQKHAFDIVITNQAGHSYKTNGKTNEDYYAFGKALIAPCDGEVVMIIDGIKDNMPGTMNRENVTGNTVMLKTANGEYLLFAHFKQSSIVVQKGQQVKRGELLGLCGNSGNSSEPHLHFHIQNTADLFSATGIKCYFEQVLVNGKIKKAYSPIQGEKISNVVQ